MQPEKEKNSLDAQQTDQIKSDTNGEDTAKKQPPVIPAVGAVGEQIQQEVQTARRPWYFVLRQARFLLVVYFIATALFGLLAFWVHVHPILGVDVLITQEFQERKAPWLKGFMIAVSYQGNAAWLSLSLIILASAALWLLRFRLEALALLVVTATSSLLNLGIKLLIHRPRPSAPVVEVLQYAAGNSFPSGHVMAYMAFWGLLFSFGILLFREWRWWRVALLVVSGLCVVLVGPSRIYLGDHWASDVLGAYLIEGLWLWFCLWLYLRLKERGVLAFRSSSHTLRNATTD